MAAMACIQVTAYNSSVLTMLRINLESKMMRVYENLMDVEDLSFKLELVESKALSSRNSSANVLRHYI